MARQIGGIGGADWDTPDRQVARKEPLHETDGDFDPNLAPDLGETFDLNEIKAIPRSALKILLRFLVPPPNRRYSKRWDVAKVRLALLARMVDLDDIGAMSLAELGEELGYTRALLSMRSLEIVDKLELNKDKLGKRRESRQTYSEVTTEYHRRVGHKMKQDAPQPAL